MIATKKKKLALILGSLLTVVAHAQDPAIDEVRPGFYKLVVDNMDMSPEQELSKMFVIGKDYFMMKEDADRYKLRYTAADLTTVKGLSVVKLNNLGTIRDEGSDIILHANSQTLPASNFDLKRNVVRSPITYTDSSFLNYTAQRDSYTKALSINSSFYKTYADGVLYNVSTNYNSSARDKISLLDFYRESYNKDKLTTTRIGTSYSGFNSLTNPVSFVGFQFKKDFSLDYNYNKSPFLSIAGTADAKSYAELYVNDQNFGTIPLSQGQYNLQNFTSGQTANNDVKLVLKDINGNVQQVQNVSLIGAPFNLSQGVSNYSFESGKFRQGYRALGDFFASGTYAYGITNKITLEGHVEASKDQKRVGLNTTYASSLGSFQYGLAFGKDEHLQRFQYNYQKGDFFANLALVRAEKFKTFGNTANLIPNQNIMSVGYRAFGANFAVQQVRYGSNSERTSLNMSKSIGRATLSLSLDKSSSGKGFSFFINMPLDAKNQWRTNTSVRNTSSGTDVDLNLNRFGQYNDWSLSLDAIKSAATGDTALSGTYQLAGQHGQATVYGSTGPNSSISTKYDGAIVFDKGIHFTRQIYQGYALVETETAGIPITLNNIDVATTGRDGVAIVPNIGSSTDNKISIQVENLPIQYQVKDNAAFVATQNYFKSSVKFKIKKNPVILQPNIDLKGISSVMINGADFYTVRKGIYFDDYTPNKEYELEVKECKVRFKVAENLKLNEVIKLKCEEK